MIDLEIGKKYIVQPISVELGNVTLYQDNFIEILDINNSKVTFRYSENNQVYSHDYSVIRIII